MAVRFKDIPFGFASAELEGAESPDLLIEGFFNEKKLITPALEGLEFLYLGHKGSGKSAINEHLRLKSEGDELLFVTSAYLADFPYRDLGNLINGDPDSAYPSAWSWLILLRLLAQFWKDEHAMKHADTDVFRTMQALVDLNLIPSTDFKQLLATTTKKGFKATLPAILDATYEVSSSSGPMIPFFLERVKHAVMLFRSQSKHLLIIDGLDDILSSDSVQYEALGGLILEVSRLNQEFSRNSVPAKVIVLCRTDLFERLPGPNKNKVRQDTSIELDWYHDPRNPEDSDLVKLANHRARLYAAEITNIFSKFLPSEIYNRPTAPYLLDQTRHTPRDFLQALKHIQKYCGAGSPNHSQVLSGLRSYSMNYLLPEIKDELSGYFKPDEIEYGLKIVGGMGAKFFSLSEIEEKCDKSILDIQQFLGALFDASAIGNALGDGPEKRFRYKYRNRNYSIDLGERLCIHRGLYTAFDTWASWETQL